MVEIKWTDAQSDAITVKAKKVLVSAAAGSGKSTVLTERIIRSLTDKEKPSDISGILAVTFTKAAAEELKLKISKAITKAVAAKPNNRHLSNQLIKLPSANISTIHGLCLSLIKSNFQTLGLNASMRVVDESEITAIRAEILDDMLETAFAGLFEPIPDFAHFSENFISERDEKLSDILLSIYDKIKNQPNGFKDWKTASESELYSFPFGDTPYGKILCKRASMSALYAIKQLENALTYIESDEKYKKAYSEQFNADLSYAKALYSLALKNDYEGIRDYLDTYSPMRLGIVRAENKTTEGEYCREIVRKYVSDTVKELKNKYFCFSEDDIIYTGKATASLFASLTDFLYAFDKRYSEYKLSRSVLDYNDLEHYTLKLLYTPDGTLSETAYSLSASFTEIYVDEYQDVNPLQNKIFEALSSECPVFMVGDIKQSIYAFRGAMPSIFSDYRRSFDEYSTEKGLTDTNGKGSTVFLSDNFRSAKPVTEFVNAVSDALFKNEPSEVDMSYRIPYSVSDRLVCGKEGTENAPNVSILVAENIPSSEREGKKPSSYYVEAEMVASKIASLIASGVLPSDIAVLLRNTKSSAPVFEEALRKRGISINSEKGSELISAPEVQLALCLINCADNPYRDIFLAGALRSPVFGFTLDELIEIRRDSSVSSLFGALSEYTVKNNFQKGVYFLDFLEKIRRFATKNTVDKVLWRIFTDTAFFTLIYDGGETPENVAKNRRSNLIKLHSIAKDLSASGKGDIYSFTERMRLLTESGKSPVGARSEGEGVQLMSIHHSKGLEFEHCFVCGCAHRLNTDDIKNSVVTDASLGIAARIKDELRLTSSDTPFRLALATLTELSQVDEEMRVLYVALTRAKTALYVCASVDDFEKTALLCRYNASVSDPMVFIEQNCYLKWILTALRYKTELAPRFNITVISERDIDVNGVTSRNTEADEQNNESKYDKAEIYRVLKERFEFKYPHIHSARLPSKLSVSRLYPEILDENNDFSTADELFELLDGKTDETNNAPKLAYPKFMSSLADTPSPAEKGTATHVFMQFCDFNELEKHGVDAEIERLCKEKFILSSHAEIIDRNAVKRFLSSDIYRQMRSARECEREYRFNIKLPAAFFTANEELKKELSDDFIFVQGVIDCYFTNSNGETVLLDYKTDTVPRYIIGNTEKEDKFFSDAHSRQLGYYRSALERLTGKTVSKTLVYSFALGRCIEIKKGII